MTEPIERALEVLEGDVELIAERNVRDFIDWRIPGRGVPRMIDSEVFYRWMRQCKRIRAKFNRDTCATVPARCHRCGETFYRKQIRQVHCIDCIALRRSAREATDG